MSGHHQLTRTAPGLLVQLYWRDGHQCGGDCEGIWLHHCHPHQPVQRDTVVLMPSTIPESRRKQTDIHLEAAGAALSSDSQLTSPDPLSNDRSACRKMKKFETAATSESRSFGNQNDNLPPVSAKSTPPPKKKQMKECCTVGSGRRGASSSSITLQLNGNRMLSVWHSPVKNPTTVIFGVPPQALLHTEEDSRRGSDCQPVWPRHRVEPGCSHSEGQTPEESAVWVDRKTATYLTRSRVTHTGGRWRRFKWSGEALRPEVVTYIE